MLLRNIFLFRKRSNIQRKRMVRKMNHGIVHELSTLTCSFIDKHNI